jgi:copper chaperone CopZ
MTVVHLYVQGMMCQQNCGRTVRQALLDAVPGAIDAQAIFAESRAWVQSNTGVASGTRSNTSTSASNIPDKHNNEDKYAAATVAVEAVEDVGFDAKPCQIIELHVKGMMCQKNCGTTVEQALQQTLGPQALYVNVNFSRQRAVVLYDYSINSDDRQHLEAVQQKAIEAIEDVGFEARQWTKADDNASAIDVERGDRETDTMLPNKPPPRLKSTATTANNSVGDTSFSLAIEGMSCAVCTGRVVRSIRFRLSNLRLFVFLVPRITNSVLNL